MINFRIGLKLGNPVQDVREIEAEVVQLRHANTQLTVELSHSVIEFSDLKSSTDRLEAENSRLRYQLKDKEDLHHQKIAVSDRIYEVIDIEPILPMPLPLTHSIGCQTDLATLESPRPQPPLEAEDTKLSPRISLDNNKPTGEHQSQIAEKYESSLPPVEWTSTAECVQLASEKTWPCWVGMTNYPDSFLQKCTLGLRKGDSEYYLHIVNQTDDVSCHLLSCFYIQAEKLRTKGDGIVLQRRTIRLKSRSFTLDENDRTTLFITFAKGKDGKEAFNTWFRALCWAKRQ